MVPRQSSRVAADVHLLE